MMETYYALIIDIVDSKKLSEKDRFNAQVRLRDGIELVDSLFKNEMLKSMNFTGGDSVQGLFIEVSTAYKAFMVIENALFPFQARAGIGGGVINQEILKVFNDDNSNMYDGEAYHKAQEALLKAKKYNREVIINADKIKDEVINPLINDKELMKMTLSRGLIYSIINLINPISEQTNLSRNYLNKVFSIIEENLLIYYRNSRVENKDKSMNRFLIQESNKHLILRDYSLQENHLSESNNFQINSGIRTLLVELTESKPQNINSLIKAGNMEYLRERAFAKVELLKILYKELEK